MKIFTSILFYLSVVLILSGLGLKFFDIPGGAIIPFTGFSGVFICFITCIINDYVSQKEDKKTVILQILVILMSPILLAKYTHFQFGDYPGLVIIPVFIIVFLIYLIKGNIKSIKLKIISIIHLVLTIPLYGLDFQGSPRQYLPKKTNNNKYRDVQPVSSDLTYEFLYQETEQLCRRAYELHHSGQYEKALPLYEEALKLEPKNSIILFSLSQMYANINNLQKAISLLDESIQIDSNYAEFYSNRGLLYYKLKKNNMAINDYLKATHIDSTLSAIYVNLALAYYYEGLFGKSCESIKKAEELGIDISVVQDLVTIKKGICIH